MPVASRGIRKRNRGRPVAAPAVTFADAEPRENRQWEPEEDALLKQFVAEMGCRWKLIAKEIPGRTEAMCRNRFQRIRAPENGAPSRNRCTYCGELKRGHTCWAKASLVIGGEAVTMAGEPRPALAAAAAAAARARPAAQPSTQLVPSATGFQIDPAAPGWTRQECYALDTPSNDDAGAGVASAAVVPAGTDDDDVDGRSCHSEWSTDAVTPASSLTNSPVIGATDAARHGGVLAGATAAERAVPRPVRLAHSLNDIGRGGLSRGLAGGLAGCLPAPQNADDVNQLLGPPVSADESHGSEMPLDAVVEGLLAEGGHVVAMPHDALAAGAVDVTVDPAAAIALPPVFARMPSLPMPWARMPSITSSRPPSFSCFAVPA